MNRRFSSPYLPLPHWLKGYRRQDLGPDLAAGLLVAVVLAPQAMAYALLAGLPPVIGLYAATLPLVVYAFLGSSRHLAVGPVALVSLLVHAGCSRLAQPGTSEYLSLVLSLAVLVGGVQLTFGLLRFGFLVNFISRAAIGGFTSAAAIIIFLSQLKHLLGIDLSGGESAFGLLYEAGSRLREINPFTMALGLISAVLLLLLPRALPRLPAPLLVVAAATAAVPLLGLHHRGVSTVGAIPHGLPGLAIPSLVPDQLLLLLPTALTIAFVGYLESYAVAEMIAARQRYRIDPNRELVGLGAANLAAAVCSGYPVTGGFSRTAVNQRAGARTVLSSLVTALVIALLLLFFTRLFFHLPKATLAAIVMVAVSGLVEWREARTLFRVRPSDGMTFVLTFLLTLGGGLEKGIIAGVGFSLLVFIWRSAHPHSAELGYLPEEGVFRNIARYPAATTFPGLLIIRVDAAVYFANFGFIADRLRREMHGRPDITRIVLDLSGVNDMDAVALSALREFVERCDEQGVEICGAGMKGPVRDILARALWPAQLAQRFGYLSVEHALGMPVHSEE